MKNPTNSNQIEITYNSSVLVNAGWRSVVISAIAELSKSGKMAKVLKVTAIDGEKPRGTFSRTGSKRQTYNSEGVAKREVGKNKRISACKVSAGLV